MDTKAKAAEGGKEMRLIDVDALTPDIGDAEIENGTKMVHYSAACIQNAATVDAAPEVRCRCCKHAKTAKSHPQWNCNHAQSPCYRRRVRGIDYCAYGEEWTGSDGEEEE